MPAEDHSLSADAFREISWNEMFEEGERRIKARFLHAMLQTPARDRARLLTQRETVQRRIHEALDEGNAKKLTRALKEQTRLLAKIKIEDPPKIAEPL